MFIDARELTAQRGGVLLLAAACFAAGLSAGALLLPSMADNPHVARSSARITPIDPLRSGYPADVTRVIDGDTFEARVHVWPGMDVTTKVRLRGIDAAELHSRCDAEKIKALAARDALTAILAEGTIGISAVGLDKYGGRIDASVSTARTQDVSAAMLGGGFARAYSGGRRESWCG